MRALHLPGLPRPGAAPPFSSPSHLPPASSLLFTSNFRAPTPISNSPKPSYMIKPTYTALTRGELTWSETLLPKRFTEAGGAIPGHDLVGTVSQILPTSVESETHSSARFNVGQRVAALIAFDRDGAAGDLVHVEEDELASVEGLTAKIPDDQVATVPLSGLSAWQGLFEHGGIDLPRLSSDPTTQQTEEREGGSRKRVLILGASGSVGVLAVQLAKAAGCWVVGTASTRNIDFIRDLGADEVIDYTVHANLGTFWREKKWASVDLILDTVGKKSLLGAMHEVILRKGAKIVTYVEPFEELKDEGNQKEEMLKAKETSVDFFIVKPDGAQLALVMELVEEGAVKGIVEKIYDLEDGKIAMEQVEAGKVRGKIVLKI